MNLSVDQQVQAYLEALQFKTIVNRMKRGGSKNLTVVHQVHAAELARYAATHNNPKVRKALTEAFNEIKKAHLEYCLRLT